MEAANAITPQAQLEALRARAFGNVSGAGIDGVEGASSPRIDNPLSLNPPQRAGGAPTDNAQARLKTDKGEAQSIVDTLSTRLKALTKRGE